MSTAWPLLSIAGGIVGAASYDAVRWLWRRWQAFRHDDSRNWRLRRILLLPLAFLLLTPAHAHDWYPVECCHAIDCAPVDRIEILPPATLEVSLLAGARPLPAMLVTSKHGSVVVPPNFPRRQSKDGRMHVCMREGEPPGGMRLLCIFMPPAM